MINVTTIKKLFSRSPFLMKKGKNEIKYLYQRNTFEPINGKRVARKPIWGLPWSLIYEPCRPVTLMLLLSPFRSGCNRIQQFLLLHLYNIFANNLNYINTSRLLLRQPHSWSWVLLRRTILWNVCWLLQAVNNLLKSFSILYSK